MKRRKKKNMEQNNGQDHHFIVYYWIWIFWSIHMTLFHSWAIVVELFLRGSTNFPWKKFIIVIFLSKFLQTALTSLEEMQHNSMGYRGPERSRNIGVGPMRSRPMEKRHDTSPYSGVPYLSPPPPDTWRRTNSDSALHQSANEACQSASNMQHRRGSDAC